MVEQTLRPRSEVYWRQGSLRGRVEAFNRATGATSTAASTDLRVPANARNQPFLNYIQFGPDHPCGSARVVPFVGHFDFKGQARTT